MTYSTMQNTDEQQRLVLLRNELSLVSSVDGPEARAAFIRDHDLDPDWPYGHPFDDHIDVEEFERNMASIQENDTGEAASGRLGPGIIPHPDLPKP